MENNWRYIEDWMNQYGDRLVKALAVMTHDDQEAQDIAQEVFIKAYQNFSSFRHESSPYTFLYIIGLNIVRSRARSLKRKPILVSLEDAQQPDHDYSPESIVCKEERKRAVINALRKLSPKLKTIISLFYISEVSIEEISEILNIREGTVKSRLFRARNQLKRIMLQEETDGYHR